ncbi:MAG: TMEM165/GDT1 family protein [Candidatus Omnitrophota bacterium]|nr:TMEM165/GDT1 family protein [Candidatus Omnitrophota bacterium]
MQWPIVAATFSAVFLAELADKTQLVGIAMAAKSGRPFYVWLGSVAAYAVVTVLSVFIGAALGKFLRPELIKYAGSIVFIVMGFLMLAGKI